ncbi:homologous recombination OB-fold protein isoform X2 [Embiotoca jacksoni]|uniref:homologous recombination OB-fold protein isoform X2 n=1 Tax=Embiotoca jacksoni TaxID=100190 RepID=UPI00370408F5
MIAMSPRPALPCFDDWDVDLADLEDCDRRVGPPPPPAPTTEPPSSARTPRPSTCGGIQTRPDRTLRATRNVPPRTFSAPHLQSPIPPLSPGVSLHCLAATSPASGLFTRTLTRPQQPQKPRATPRPSPQARGLFPTAFPVPCGSSASSASSALSPHPLHTPVLTNRLVQLVSASNQLPKKRPRSEPHRPRTRRFPGPAGLLPQQPDGRNLDEIVVSAPQTPAHGVVARLPSQGSSSQTEEDEFGGGAWAAMKAEMGLDERNPSCFLHSYSVVMVLRKAALKQLAGNKVPNMAVLLKSIIHTHADAKALFKDPTGTFTAVPTCRNLHCCSHLQEPSLLFPPAGTFTAVPPCRNLHCCSPLQEPSLLFPPAGTFTAVPTCRNLRCCSPLQEPSLLFPPAGTFTAVPPCRNLRCCSPLQEPSLLFPPAGTFAAVPTCRNLRCCSPLQEPSLLFPPAGTFAAVPTCRNLRCCSHLQEPSLLSPPAGTFAAVPPDG